MFHSAHHRKFEFLPLAVTIAITVICHHVRSLCWITIQHYSALSTQDHCYILRMVHSRTIITNKIALLDSEFYEIVNSMKNLSSATKKILVVAVNYVIDYVIKFPINFNN